MKATLSVFRLLAKPVQDILDDLRFSEPTEPQAKAIPAVLGGENVLLVAPNGAGKTEAALLPILSKIVEKGEIKGILVLYITPLRALNRDMIKRLSYWGSKLRFSVQVRHSDTSAATRRKQAVQPPAILVTTPETLQAILPGSRMQQHLSHIRHVIVDEVHELATNKRGVQLSVALERLSELVGDSFQRIGLSATVADLEKAAKFIAGAERPIRVVKVPLPKGYTYSIECPSATDEDYSAAHKLRTTPEAAARIRRILSLVKKHASTLIFVNSRTNAEMLGHRFDLLTDAIAVHHGSLSAEERTRIENKFKENTLKAIVCTSTLELGIDIGQVDLVIQYLSPRQVATLIQRVGRSGHRLDLVSKGVIVAAFAEDALESLAASRKARKGQLEPLLTHENALDVVAHQIAGIVMDKKTVSVDNVSEIFRRAHPFRNLSQAKLLEVASYLHSLKEVNLEGGVLKKTKRTLGYYYRNLSMIADERRYPIVDVVADRRIGTLGDEFMALKAREGLNFICKGKVWRIVQIEDETGTVYVVPSEDKFAAIPGWDGEMLSVTFDLAQEVGRLREEIGETLKAGCSVDSTAAKLAEKFETEKDTVLESAKDISVHLKEHLPLPTHTHVLFEAFDKYIVVHACFGDVVNRTLGSVLDAILSNHNLIVGWWNDGYRILIETPAKVDSRVLDKVTGWILRLSSKEVDKAFNSYVEARFPFSYRMKSVAERFGALPRGRTMSSEKMAKLPSKFKKTPVYEETIREAMTEKVDTAAVKRIIKDLKKRRIKVSRLLRKQSPTIFAHHIFTKYSEAAELMAPEHVVLNNIQRMKRTALAKTARFLCISCGVPVEETAIKDLPEKPVCSRCGSGLLAKLLSHQNPETLYRLLKKRRKGKKLTSEELEQLAYARRTADLLLSYGRKAVVALQTKGVGPETAFRILGKMHPEDEEFYVDLLKAKIAYIKSSPFWRRKNDDKWRRLRGEKA